MGLILLDQGADPADFTEDEWASALDALGAAKDSGQIRQFTGNNYAQLLAQGTIAACIAWSGDVIQLQFDNPDIKFVIPEAGGMLWSDNMLIPINAQHKANAEAWMNYYYDPKVAAELAAWVNYICPVDGAQEELAKTDPKLAENPLIFPSEDDYGVVDLPGPQRRRRDPVRRGVPVHRGLIAGLSFRVRPCHTEPLRSVAGAHPRALDQPDQALESPAFPTDAESGPMSEQTPSLATDSTSTGGGADLHIVDVTKRFGSFKAVDDLTLTIPAGSFFALLGPSGCGKTTTLRMVAGLEEPSEGRIVIGAEDVTHNKPYKRPVNTVFQSYALFPHLDIFENVAFGLRRSGNKDVRDEVEAMLELVELSTYARRKPTQLSGGQQQRVAVARALINKPEVLLLDEPLGALDLKLRRQMQIELKRIQTDVGITFVHVTHDQEEAMTMADTIAVMNAGRDRADGRPDGAVREPGHHVRRQLPRSVEPDQGHADRQERWRRAAGRSGPADGDADRARPLRARRRLGRRTAREDADQPGGHTDGRRERRHRCGDRRQLHRGLDPVPRATCPGARRSGSSRRTCPPRDHSAPATTWFCTGTRRTPSPSTPRRMPTPVPRRSRGTSERGARRRCRGKAPADDTARPVGKSSWTPYALLTPGMLWLAVFFVVPTIMLLRMSLSSGNAFYDNLGFSVSDLQWGNYGDAWNQYVIDSPIFQKSLVYALIATVLTLVIAYPLAYTIAFKSGRWKNFLLVLVIAPFFTSFLLRTNAWQTILVDSGPVVTFLNDIGVLNFLHTVTNTPDSWPSWAQIFPDGITAEDRVLATPLAVIVGLAYNFLPVHDAAALREPGADRRPADRGRH